MSKDSRGDAAGAATAGAPFTLTPLEEQLLSALQETWRVLDSAGLLNLSNGVQLGQTSWYVKAMFARQRSDAAIGLPSTPAPAPTRQQVIEALTARGYDELRASHVAQNLVYAGIVQDAAVP